MKKLNKLFALILTLVLGVSIVGCKKEESDPKDPVFVDYASQLKLDMDSTYDKVEVNFKLHIDGDTTHFTCANSSDKVASRFGFDNDWNGVIKIRYAGVDTPESTGAIEKWGLQASNFTKARVSNATSIIIEAEDTQFKPDSTGSRLVGFVWYKLNDTDDYKCLNLELMQEGFSLQKGSSSTQYGSYFTKAYEQAEVFGLHMHNKDLVDVLWDDGSTRPQITIKDLKESIDKDGASSEYINKAIRFDGLITKKESNYVYLQQQVEDEDTSEISYYGFKLYLGMSPSSAMITLLSVGNQVSIAGTVTYTDSFGYQVTNLNYMKSKPNNPNNCRLISEGNELVPCEVNYSTMTTSSKARALEWCLVKYNSPLTVTKISATDSGGNNDGALTITCKDGNNSDTIKIRTSKIYKSVQVIDPDTQQPVLDSNTQQPLYTKVLVTPTDIPVGTVINSVTGVIEYNYGHQIHVFDFGDLEIAE